LRLSPETAGKAISQLLAGAAPATLSFPAIAATRLNVDWRQLRRFGIAAEAIPYDAVRSIFGQRKRISCCPATRFNSSR
jgi:hypothetical protein